VAGVADAARVGENASIEDEGGQDRHRGDADYQHSAVTTCPLGDGLERPDEAVGGEDAGRGDGDEDVPRIGPDREQEGADQRNERPADKDTRQSRLRAEGKARPQRRRERERHRQVAGQSAEERPVLLQVAPRMEQRIAVVVVHPDRLAGSAHVVVEIAEPEDRIADPRKREGDRREAEPGGKSPLDAGCAPAEAKEAERKEHERELRRLLRHEADGEDHPQQEREVDPWPLGEPDLEIERRHRGRHDQGLHEPRPRCGRRDTARMRRPRLQ
jgi:hypothetical protein